MKQLKKIKKAITTTAISVSILTPATMLTANAAVITYTVKSGDTLSAIAKKYNVPLASLESANKITNPDAIKVGQVLTIPSTSATTTTTAATTTSSTVTYTVYTGTATITAATSIYASPSSSAKIVEALPKGSKWKLYGYRSDGWYNIGAGWVKASCASTSILTKGATTAVSGGTTTTTSSAANTTTAPSTNTPTSSTITYTVYTGTATITTATSIYASPSSSAKMVGTLAKGSKWKLYGSRSDGWYNIGAGWVKASSASATILTKGATTVVSGGTTTTTSSAANTTTMTATNATASSTVTYTVYTGTATITTATSIYASPSSSAKIVGTLVKGSKWKLYGSRSDGWYNIGAGWVKASCASTTILTKGATTVVSGGTTTTSSTTTANKTTTTAATSTTSTYIVVSGDSASVIAKKFGLTLAQFQALNPQISNLNLLYVGEVVNIQKAAASTASTTTASTSTGVPVPPAPAAGQMIYKVLSGDTAISIANKYSMTLAELQQINPQVTNWNVLAAKQQILVYAPSDSLSAMSASTNVTSSMKSAFIAEVAPAAIQAWKTNKILPSLTIAQAILESYWGESYLSSKAQNYFGIKASVGWTGATISVPTKEYDANGNPYIVNAVFRAYSDISDSIADHTELLMASRYSNLIGVTDYKKATTLIQQDGYATDPYYTSLLQSEITTYNLTKYDIQAGAI